MPMSACQAERPGSQGRERLKTLLSYQEQAIVSRMLVKNTGGNVEPCSPSTAKAWGEHRAL